MDFRAAFLKVGKLAGWSGLFVAMYLSAQAPDKSGVGPTAISLPSGPGSIEGLGESFEPQLNSGGSTYSVGIEVAPGRVGFQPSLSLAYNSGLGNSLVGIGWTLSIPEIRRQIDKGFPAYDSQIDTFLFQGEELVPLSDGFYRCENESGFQRFQPIDSNQDGLLDAWEMVERNGVRHTFGRFRGEGNRWSAVEHPKPPPQVLGRPLDTTYCWMLDTSTDLHGNRIEYEYERGTGKLYPARITYSHSDAGAQEVLLEYEERPDVFDDYRPTFSSRIDRRLKEVIIRSLGNLVRRYELAYARQPDDLIPFKVEEQQARTSAYDLGVSLLKRFTQFDNSGSSENYLPPLRFYYSFLDGDLSAAKVQSVEASLGDVPRLDVGDPSGHVQLADVNADGLPDLFSTKPQGPVGLQQVMLNRGVGADGRLRFSAPILASDSSTLNLSLPQSSLSDRDGDGIVDYEVVTDEFTGKRIEVYSNRSRFDRVNENRLGFAPLQATRTEFIAGAPAYVGIGSENTLRMDLNFDKVSDYLNSFSDFTGLTLRGFYRAPNGDWQQFANNFSGIPSTHTLDRPVSGDDNLLVTLADMNGDRMQDYVAVERLGGISATLRVTYWPYCSLGEWAEARSIETSVGDLIEFGGGDLRDVLVQDFTGDGLADLLILDGSGFGSALTLRANVAGHAWARPLKKSGLPIYRPRDATAPTVFRTADLNGNGSTDLIWRNSGFGGDTWEWLDLMPQAGKPNLLTRIDNSIGKLTNIVYGNAHEDYIRAQDSGAPWTTTIPFSVQVVRQIRTQNGYDLNGDQLKDTYVSEFQYRDAYYDGFEKEFRGFAFAERIDYGDDFIWDPEANVMKVSEGWDRGKTPTGQVHGPSLVTRYRFHTGSADGQDNDESEFGGQLIDEYTITGGREEEALKGKQLLEEKIDPWVLHNGDLANRFDAACSRSVSSGNLYASVTSDSYVYTRTRQHWGLRRLYRPAEELEYWADLGGDEPVYQGNIFPVPGARFSTGSVRNGIGKDVSFAFVRRTETDVIEANALLHEALAYEQRSPKQTRLDFDYDDYGNEILSFNHGIVGEGYDDERRIETTYAHGGNALARWIVDRPDTVLTTDENGVFANKTVHHYDGMPFVGLKGTIADRALLHRVEKFVDEIESVDAERSEYDRFGNIIEVRDGNHSTEFDRKGGHYRNFRFDNALHIYPVAEIVGVSQDQSELVIRAEYDLGFGIVSKSWDFNRNITLYQYDSFARLVSVVKPYDSEANPTTTYAYRPFDVERALAYDYDSSGELTLAPGGLETSRVLVHQREEAAGGVYTTAILSDGRGKTIAAYGENVTAGSWIVSGATSYNLRGVASSSWLPYQVRGDAFPSLQGIWPSGRPPVSDGVSPQIVENDQITDPLGRGIKRIVAPERWGADRSYSSERILPFELRKYDENDTDSNSDFVDTPLVHFEDGLGRVVTTHEVVRLNNEGERIANLSNWETIYDHDLNDRVVRIASSHGFEMVARYDALARLKRLTHPDCGQVDYSYDDNSNLIQTIDAKGQQIRYFYDGANRLIGEDYVSATDSPFDSFRFDPSKGVSPANRPEVALFYDRPSEGNQAASAEMGNTMGQLAYVWDESGEEHFGYDSRSRMTHQVKVIENDLPNISGGSYVTSFTFDSSDRVSTISYPDGDMIRYVYNNRSLLSAISNLSGKHLVANIDYTSAGLVEGYAYFNGLRTSRSYDPRLRLTDVTVRDSSNAAVFELGLSLARNGNVVGQSERFASPGVDYEAQHVYAYDDLYRLNRSSLAGGGDEVERTYRYKPTGSIAWVGGPDGESSYRYDGGPEQGNTFNPFHLPRAVIANGQTKEVLYDGNGNVSEHGNIRLTHDFKNRLVELVADGVTTSNIYDFQNRRVVGKVTDDTGNVSTTHYINKYFEVRPGEEPVKYLWIDSTRVAKTTGMFSPSAQWRSNQVLFEGWNLSLGSSGNETGSFQWDESRQSWRAQAGGTVSPEKTVWIHADETRSVVISSAPLGMEQFVRLNLQGGLWVPNLPVFRELVSESAERWGWDARQQNWVPLGRLKELGVEDREKIRIQAFYDPESERMDDSLENALTNISFYHQDHLGSTRLTTSATGAVLNRFVYTPFGERRALESVPGEEDYSYSGMELEGVESVYAFDRRHYSVDLKTFLSPDPIVSSGAFLDPKNLESFVLNPQGLNAFGYAKNNPVTLIDHQGLEAKKPEVKTSWFQFDGVELFAVKAGGVVNFKVKLFMDYERATGSDGKSKLITSAGLEVEAGSSASGIMKSKVGVKQTDTLQNGVRTLNNKKFDAISESSVENKRSIGLSLLGFSASRSQTFNKDGSVTQKTSFSIPFFKVYEREEKFVPDKKSQPRFDPRTDPA